MNVGQSDATMSSVPNKSTSDTMHTQSNDYESLQSSKLQF